jgi:hypothetical protein
MVFETDPSVAVMVDEPGATPVRRPPTLTVTAAGVPELQVTEEVRSAVEASE